MASRRAGSDRAAQNAQTLKALVKLDGNKVCADCKRNKHPRWASWNLGVFICIRCSGVHRGMGTHISRVKSVDLDAWTDEQLQSVLKWGNNRANKYWEARLAPGHQPSEAKIENFIRTKYESRRWVMEGPMPDPSTLDTDDEVPLHIVQEKARIERAASQHPASPGKAQVQRRPAPAPAVDLFGDIAEPRVRRLGTADSPDTKPASATQPTSTAPVPSKPAPRPHESLANLDFFGNAPPAAARASSAASTATQLPFGELESAPAQSKDSFGGLADAFGGLNFSSTAAVTSGTSRPAQSPPPSVRGLGSFVSSVPAKGAPLAPQRATAASPPAPKPGPRPSVASKAAAAVPADLFNDDDFGGSAFNLSAPAPAPAQASPPRAAASQHAAAAAAAASSTSNALFDPWSSATADSSPWGAPEPAASKPARPNVELGKVPSHITPNDITGGWGAPISGTSKSTAQPTVAADEDFGGWASGSTTQTPAAANAPKASGGSGGFGGASDPFDNPWG
ncbi:hypothetical protein DV737_g2760, partial [Chaetothyriales sp. CBS 132003]